MELSHDFLKLSHSYWLAFTLGLSIQKGTRDKSAEVITIGLAIQCSLKPNYCKICKITTLLYKQGD